LFGLKSQELNYQNTKRQVDGGIRFRRQLSFISQTKGASMTGLNQGRIEIMVMNWA
jgi:hypothetical protein